MQQYNISDVRKLINDIDIGEDLKSQLENLSDDDFRNATENLNKSLNEVIKAFVNFQYQTQEIIKQAIQDRVIDIDWDKLSFENNKSV